MPSPSPEESIFYAAVELNDASAREDYLNRACEQNAALRRRVNDLLSAYEDGAFLESPVAVLAATSPLPFLSEKPGTMIGPYRLLEQIGEGGMGLVFMAEQTQPLRRRVALKVVKPGLDSRAVIARFEAERQALALMDHPNIACVFDGGATESGRPYFVMELVHGVPITDYFRERDLPLSARLELFIEICEAVQHAHRKGIIHRDLKPTNILVSQTDTGPVPKVIDFGVAKAIAQPLTDRTLFTHFTQIIGTPLYMSPEQADLGNQDVDTRSDVYSLGVVLYELLTGTTPFGAERLRSVTHDEMRRIIREEEPPKPSTRATTLAAVTNRTTPPSERQFTGKMLKGDLDRIVLKALAKDRRQRYASPGDFAADVRRYLHDEPVEAVAPGFVYSFQKFVRRHRWRLALAAVLLSTCLLGIVGLGVTTVTIAESLEKTKVAERHASQDRDRFRNERDRAESALYVADIRLAHEEWKHGRIAEMKRLLNAHLPRAGEHDLRGWEWHYLSELIVNSSVAIGDKSMQFSGVAWSPDGRRLAIADGNYDVRIWDAVNRRELHVLRGHSDSICCVEWSPDGRRIASADQGGKVRIWEVEAGKSSVIEASDTELMCVAWSPDGIKLATAGESEFVKVWDANTRQELARLPGHDEIVWWVAWSPDGQRVASVDNWRSKTIRIWDVNSEKLLTSKAEAHSNTMRSVSWSPDGKHLATGADDCLVKIWEIEKWSCQTLTGHAGDVTSVGWSPDGARLASSSADGTIIIWNHPSGSSLGTLRGHEGSVSLVRWSSDGSRLASASADGTVRLWDPERPDEFTRFIAESGAAWSPDGTQLAFLAQQAPDRTERIQIINNSTCELSGESIRLSDADGTTRHWGVAWSPNGRMLAIECAATKRVGIKIADVVARTELATFFQASEDPQVRSIAFNPDARLIAVASLDGGVVVWDIATGKQVTSLPMPDGFPNAVAWSPDGRRLAVTTFDGAVSLWNTTTWQRTMHMYHHPRDRRPGSGGPHLVCWGPDGTMFAAGTVTGCVIAWDANTGREVLSFSAHSSKIRAVAFSPDGSRIATGGLDKLVKIWDAYTGVLLLTLGGHDSPVLDLAWSPDGTRLLTSDDSGHSIWAALGAAHSAGK